MSNPEELSICGGGLRTAPLAHPHCLKPLGSGVGDHGKPAALCPLERESDPVTGPSAGAW